MPSYNIIWTGESHTISYSPVRAADITSHATNGGDNNIIVGGGAKRAAVVCDAKLQFLARYLIRGRPRVVLQSCVLRVPCTFYYIYVHMDKWIDLSRTSLISLRTYTSGRRLYTLDNARGLTHTHKWHIILYTRPEQCQQFARPLSVQARTRLSKTGKLYDRERGSSAAPTQQQQSRWLYSNIIIYTCERVCIRTICASWSHPHHQRIITITIIIVTILLCIHNLII